MNTSPHPSSPDDGRGAGPPDRSFPDDDAAPGPLSEASSRRGANGTRREGYRINPARMEVRVRRIALVGLVLVPLIYFIVQSLR
ncbi:hypothetical protein KocCE7_11240 [Kocuria marina subsp. indica]|uniref:hypothetical protein n=1 Tax=Kocuria TaxID=57493 RepID=UPI00103CE89A|nr:MULTISPECIES: hypothetical protein [Kocuria]MBX7556190.1 hypothetical protein [Streptomyces sp. tea 10]MDT0120635.1 hypothetical protein [Kocuria sp. PD6]QBJ22280.1 hypothetical protein KocCE7_11240 [Kocuria indica]